MKHYSQLNTSIIPPSFHRTQIDEVIQHVLQPVEVERALLGDGGEQHEQRLGEVGARRRVAGHLARRARRAAQQQRARAAPLVTQD